MSRIAWRLRWRIGWSRPGSGIEVLLEGSRGAGDRISDRRAATGCAAGPPAAPAAAATGAGRAGAREHTTRAPAGTAGTAGDGPAGGVAGERSVHGVHESAGPAPAPALARERDGAWTWRGQDERCDEPSSGSRGMARVKADPATVRPPDRSPGPSKQSKGRIAGTGVGFVARAWSVSARPIG